jgi:hypothetical protein
MARPPLSAADQRRRNQASRAGLAIGAFFALVAATVNLVAIRDRLTMNVGLTIVLLSLLNIPLFVGLALLAERVSRGRGGDGRHPRR